MEQRTDEWYNIRLGKVTASCLDDVMAAKTTAGYQNYLAKLVAERLTGNMDEMPISQAMQRGIDLEDEAKFIYMMKTGNTVIDTGFVLHPEIDNTGASPDGLIDDDGLIEIKCPNTATHIKTIKSGKPSLKYIRQMQWQMRCTGRLWCDFVSYDNRLPTPTDLFIKRINRDESLIAEIETAVIAFLNEVDETVKYLKSINV